MNLRLTEEKQGFKRQIGVVYTRNGEVMEKPMARARHMIHRVIDKDLKLNGWLDQ